MALAEIGVVGTIGHVGGANTELGHQVTCWLGMGMQVHIVPAQPLDQHAQEVAQQYRQSGCIYHAARRLGRPGRPAHDQLLQQKLSGESAGDPPARPLHYLRQLHDVELPHGNPAPTRRIDRLSSLPDAACARAGRAKRRDLGIYRPLQFNPYFDAEPFPFIDPASRPRDFFRFGRISRGDADKHGRQQLWIYETMTAPVLKQGVILGWDQRAEKKFGRRPPAWIATYPERRMSQQQFYQYCDAVVMTTDTFENLPRVGFEAMASGSVLVVDQRGGWLLQIDDGRTGWLCRDQREFVYKASRCAFEHEECAAMAVAARQKVLDGWGFSAAADSWACVRGLAEPGPWANAVPGRFDRTERNADACGGDRMNRDEIRDRLKATKIASLQLDPNGDCNLSCWYCPRGHMPNPPHAVTQMPPELLETIVAQCAMRTGVFSENFRHLWTAHYNEVLLYRHFGEMLGIFAKHGFVTTLLSNGTLFDDDRVTIVAENVRKCTICGICLNIPAGEYDAYRRYTGQGPETFARMRDGVAKLLAALPDDFLNRKACSIMVNGVDDKTVDQRSYVGSAAPYMPAMDMYNQVEALKRLFPRANVYPAGGKLDLAGHLARFGAEQQTALAQDEPDRDRLPHQSGRRRPAVRMASRQSARPGDGLLLRLRVLLRLRRSDKAIDRGGLAQRRPRGHDPPGLLDHLPNLRQCGACIMSRAVGLFVDARYFPLAVACINSLRYYGYAGEIRVYDYAHMPHLLRSYLARHVTVVDVPDHLLAEPTYGQYCAFRPIILDELGIADSQICLDVDMVALCNLDEAFQLVEAGHFVGAEEWRFDADTLWGGKFAGVAFPRWEPILGAQAPRQFPVYNGGFLGFSASTMSICYDSGAKPSATPNSTAGPTTRTKSRSVPSPNICGWLAASPWRPCPGTCGCPRGISTASRRRS